MFIMEGIILDLVRYEILVKITVFLYVMSYSPVGRYQCSRETYINEGKKAGSRLLDQTTLQHSPLLPQSEVPGIPEDGLQRQRPLSQSPSLAAAFKQDVHLK
jgi:hypothetical protein